MNTSHPPSGESVQPSPAFQRVCPVTGRPLEPPPRRLGLLGWLFSGLGLASLLWFLVRVIPKPSRAAYPCQKIAFPMASGFLVWVGALAGSAFAWRKARNRGARFWKACLWGAAAIAGCALVLASLPAARSWADNPPNAPVGQARGIFPGRVAWVYAPAAVNWAGYTSTEHWYDTNHTDISVVEQMISQALQSVGGGGSGRLRTELSSVPFYWSVTNAIAGQPVVPDYVPAPLAQANYLIDFAVLKGHSVGVTLCTKNFHGALLRCPDGYFRDAFGPNQGGILNYANMHTSTADPSLPGTPGRGHYRAMVDLLGSPVLGGKTLLFLVDGLFGGYFWDSHPKKWTSAPFNGNWPSSLFASQDPVAIDSVCYDFLYTEWPNVVENGSDSPGNALQGGAEDYLYEAALANNPPSGTFYDPGKTGARLSSLGVHEHWNSPAAKQYSRNLDPLNGTGIELVQLTATKPSATLAITQAAGHAVLWWRTSLLGYKFQTATSLSSPQTWSDVAALPALVQWWNTVTNNPGEPSQFYRLSQ